MGLNLAGVILSGVFNVVALAGGDVALVSFPSAVSGRA